MFYWHRKNAQQKIWLIMKLNKIRNKTQKNSLTDIGLPFFSQVNKNKTKNKVPISKVKGCN